MKRIGNIYSKIIDKNNIRKAILNAAKRKRSRKNVRYILTNIVSATDEIYNLLKNETFEPSPYEKVKIMDGVRKKERIIYKPAFFPDQCIHWALMLQLEEVLMKGMYYYNCASIKGRGLIHASKYIQKILVKDRKNTKYCLKLDVKKFYPSIDKEILKRKFRRKIKERETLSLIDKIIDSSEEGLPIGNFTSQWFANFFLEDFDHFIKENLKVPYYIRYMDDMLLFHRNKKELRKVKDEIEIYLHKENLKLKENWQLFKTESRPIDFLGYRFYRGYTTLRRSNFLRIKRRIKKVYKKQKLNSKDVHAILSYTGWIKHSDSYKIRKKYIEQYIDLKKCKEVVKNEGRKQYKAQ